MTVGHPYILLALLLVPLLALLYIRRARKREITVPSLMLWRTAATTGAADAGKRTGALDLPLVLALLFLVAAIVAASGPVLVTRTNASPILLIIADRSASMAARTESGETRWARTVEYAAAPLDRARGGSVMLVGLPLAAGPGLDNLTPAEAKSALDKLTPTDMPLDLVKELARCAGLAGRSSAVIVITDDAALVPEKLAGKPVLVLSYGGPSANVAIDAFEVSRNDDGKLVAFVAVRNYAGKPATVPVAIEFEGGPSPGVQKHDLELAPKGSATLTAALGVTDADVVEVRLGVKDDLASDNRAVAVRSGAGRVRVAYVGRGNQFIERALQLLPGVDLSQFRLTRDVKGGFDLVIYDRVTPDTLPAGDVVLIDPAGKIGPFEVQDAAAGDAWMRVAAVNESPLLENVDTGALRFKHLARVKAEAAAKTLLESAEARAAALVRWENADARITLVGCRLVPAETNWPMLPSFPFFWANIVDDAGGGKGREDLPTCSLTGEYVTLKPKGDQLTVTGPDGKRVSLVPGAGARSHFLPTTAGIYQTEGVRYAVNMIHPSESDTSGSEATPSPELLESVLAPSDAAGVSLLPHLAIIALALAFGHWFTAARGRR